MCGGEEGGEGECLGSEGYDTWGGGVVGGEYCRAGRVSEEKRRRGIVEGEFTYFVHLWGMGRGCEKRQT